jgi:hypothetical protein
MGPGLRPAFDLEVLPWTHITSVTTREPRREVRMPFDLGEAPFESVLLTLELGTSCFPFEDRAAPPAGQNYPADCDAFDRLLEVTIDKAMEEGDPPGFEVMHGATPFGGPTSYTVDITDLANAHPGEHELHVYISTSSDPQGLVSGSEGGWDARASLSVVPGEPPRRVLSATPLFHGITRGEAMSASFAVPEGAGSTRIEYRTTGHGGTFDDVARCNAEEFCQRWHALVLDDGQRLDTQPWRDDCADLCTLEHYGPTDGGFDYCAENPNGAIGSVRASRANWCPGSLTPPIVYEPSLSAGSHTLTASVERIIDGGSWRMSAIAYSYE